MRVMFRIKEKSTGRVLKQYSGNSSEETELKQIVDSAIKRNYDATLVEIERKEMENVVNFDAEERNSAECK